MHAQASTPPAASNRDQTFVLAMSDLAAALESMRKLDRVAIECGNGARVHKDSRF